MTTTDAELRLEGKTVIHSMRQRLSDQPDKASKFLDGIFNELLEDAITADVVSFPDVDKAIGSLAGNVTAVAALVGLLLDRVVELENQLTQLRDEALA